VWRQGATLIGYSTVPKSIGSWHRNASRLLAPGTACVEDLKAFVSRIRRAEVTPSGSLFQLSEFCAFFCALPPHNGRNKLGSGMGISRTRTPRSIFIASSRFGGSGGGSKPCTYARLEADQYSQSSKEPNVSSNRILSVRGCSLMVGPAILFPTVIRADTGFAFVRYT
jgi:hypothetical protein